MINTKTTKGFTLMELIVSMSIFVILISMMTVIFRGTQESFLSASSMQKVFDTSRSIIHRIHDELSASFYGPSGRTGLLGIDAGGSKLKSNSTGAEVYFNVPLSEQSDSEISEIGYWLRNDGQLMRHYEETADYDFATETADDELGLIIDNLDIQFFDGLAYQLSWDSRKGGAEDGRAPKAVKISFSVSDEKDVITKTFETLVHISSGKRY